MMRFSLNDIAGGGRVAELHFAANGQPVVTGAGSRAEEIFNFVSEMDNVWLPRTKQRVVVDWKNKEHRAAVAAGFGPLGLYAQPETRL